MGNDDTQCVRVVFVGCRYLESPKDVVDALGIANEISRAGSPGASATATVDCDSKGFRLPTGTVIGATCSEFRSKGVVRPALVTQETVRSNVASDR